MNNAKVLGWSKSRALLPCCLVALALIVWVHLYYDQLAVQVQDEPGTKMSSFEKMHKQLHKFAAAPNRNVEKKK